MNDLRTLRIAGPRVRRALSALAGAGPGLRAALVRGHPFLARRKTVVSVGEPRAIASGSASSALGETACSATFTDAVGGVGAVTLDATATQAFISGAFGGRAVDPSQGAGSPGRRAVAARVADSLTRMFTPSLLPVGVEVHRIGGEQDLDATGPLIALELRLGDGERGRIHVLVALASVELALARHERAAAACRAISPDDSVASAHMELVAELGSFHVAASLLAGLGPGALVSLPLPTTREVLVRAGGRALFFGRPTAAGSLVGVELLRHAA